MHFRQLDLNLLVALDALLTELNITEAGRRVHLTQSAMSGALARLREYFDDELLVQVGRKMVPTPLANSLSESVREILQKIKSTIATKGDFDPAKSTRRFSLLMSDYVSTVLMNRVLVEAERVAPHVTFEVISNDMGSPYEVLERADVDFLLMPPDYLSRSHPSELLFQDDYACVVWADNPLVGDSISTQQYLELGHVVLQFGRRSPAIDEFFLNHLGVNRRIEVVAMNFNAIPQCIVGTHRIATVQLRLAQFYAKYLPLRLVPPPFDIPPLRESMQWHTVFDQDPGSIWLRGLLKDSAQSVESAPVALK
ncbi:MAG TPA: LysR family transcriptional regulator [Steroidobacteraceae bacterium]|nr:LysR family transcriptional regulator [Steroidobacteraceae bacterium]